MAGVTWERYGEAVVRLHLPSGPVLLVPGAGVPEAASLPAEAGGGPISVVTAHNPGGRVVSDSANRRAHRELVARLDREGVSHHPAAGGDRDWVHVEEGVAIVGLALDASVSLGRDLGQDAIFVWTSEGFSLVDCATGDAVSSEWMVAPTPPALARVDAAYRALGLATPYVSLATAYAALDRALVSAPPDEARRLNALYLELASDYYRPRDAEEARRRELERVLEAERAAFREARARAREAAREVAAARAREARAKAEAQHERDVAAGWPAAWRPKQVRAWTRLGGDAASASAFDVHGWAPHEVVAAGIEWSAAAAESGVLVLPGLAGGSIASAGSAGSAGSGIPVGSVAGLVPPLGSARHHERLGDTLADLLTGVWPPAPEGTVLSMRRALPSGRRERWFVVEERAGASVSVVCHVCRGSGPWRSTAVGRHESAAAAVAATPALHGVRADAVTEYAAPGLADSELLRLLRVPSGALPSGIVVDSVPCTLDGRRLAAVRVGRRWRWAVLTPDGDALAGEEIARSTWFSESGGAPISWEGGNSLTVVAPGVLEDRQWGDEGASRTIVEWPDSVTGRARVLADWIARLDLQTAAALILEDWPDEEAWLEWHSVSLSLTIDVGEEARAALRRRLGASDPAYREARHAVRHPHSARGRQLSAALAEAVLTDFTGELRRGTWTGR